MEQLLNLTSEQRQNKTYDFEGKKITIILYYSEVNLGWFITIKEGDFMLQNARLTCNYNYLDKWRRKLNWGLQVLSDDGIDPFDPDDLSSGRVKLYFLNSDEVYYVTNFIFRDNSELLLANDENLSLL